MPVRSDAALAEALSALELGADVPEALWVAVAKTLAWAYKLDAKAGSADSAEKTGVQESRADCRSQGSRAVSRGKVPLWLSALLAHPYP